jgi:hypothetical protein
VLTIEPAQQQGVGAVPAFERQLFDAATFAGRAGVVEDDVQAAERCRSVVDGLADLFGLHDIAVAVLQLAGELPLQPGTVLVLDVCRQHPRAFFDEALHRGQADARTRAGDEGDLVFQPVAHAVSKVVGVLRVCETSIGSPSRQELHRAAPPGDGCAMHYRRGARAQGHAGQGRRRVPHVEGRQRTSARPASRTRSSR